MKILTLNTWQEKGPWRERWELILRGLAEHDADLVGLQEVFNMDWAEEARARSGYPYLAVSGEHSGLIFLSKFRPVEQACHIMKTRSPNEEYLRYAFYVRFDKPSGPFAAFNTHFSWKAEDGPVRAGQAMELAGFVMEKAAGIPTAVMGDFNTAPNTVPALFLTESRKWTDVFAAANPDAPGLTWDYKNPYAEAERAKMAERRIDYIFVTGHTGPFAKVRSAKVVFNRLEGGVWPSDHFGVLAEFSGK